MKRGCIVAGQEPGILFSPAFSGGLIEAMTWPAPRALPAAFSPAFSGGLIEAGFRAARETCSLDWFSPAFSGGLIEARFVPVRH